MNTTRARLPLRLDALQVQSFCTSDALSELRGTVAGHQESAGMGSCRPDGCGAESDHPVFCPVAVPTTDMPTAQIDECA
jgi:hypothetical protein